MLRRISVWMAVMTALASGFLVGKATDAVFSGGSQLASDRSDLVEPTASVDEALPIPEPEPSSTTEPLDRTPPEIRIVNPVDGVRVAERTARIEGFAERGATVTVGGYAVTSTPEGAWFVALKLQPGANSVTATATDPAGNRASATVNVVYEPPEKRQDTPPAPKEPGEEEPAKGGGACGQTVDTCKPACSASSEGCKPACPATYDGCKPACPATNEGCASPPLEGPLDGPTKIPEEAPAEVPDQEL